MRLRYGKVTIIKRHCMRMAASGWCFPCVRTGSGVRPATAGLSSNVLLASIKFTAPPCGLMYSSLPAARRRNAPPNIGHICPRRKDLLRNPALSSLATISDRLRVSARPALHPSHIPAPAWPSIRHRPPTTPYGTPLPC